MALVNAVKTFEDSALICRRDTDTGVLHLEQYLMVFPCNTYLDRSIRTIVLDGVVTVIFTITGEWLWMEDKTSISLVTRLPLVAMAVPNP